jgi:hypothetical protein
MVPDEELPEEDEESSDEDDEESVDVDDDDVSAEDDVLVWLTCAVVVDDPSAGSLPAAIWM